MMEGHLATSLGNMGTNFMVLAYAFRQWPQPGVAGAFKEVVSEGNSMVLRSFSFFQNALNFVSSLFRAVLSNVWNAFCEPPVANFLSFFLNKVFSGVS